MNAATRNRALIVEDNQDLAEVLGVLVEQVNFKVKVVTRAQDALPHFEHSDVLFTDYNLACPTFNGRELARQFKVANPTGFVVLLSGSEKSMQTVDVDTSLRKPVDAQAFCKAAKHAWRMVNLPHIVRHLVEASDELVEHARFLREMNVLLQRWSRKLTT